MWLVVYIYICVSMSQTGDNSGGLGQISKFSGNLMGFLYITDNILVRKVGNGDIHIPNFYRVWKLKNNNHF